MFWWKIYSNASWYWSIKTKNPCPPVLLVAFCCGDTALLVAVLVTVLTVEDLNHSHKKNQLCNYGWIEIKLPLSVYSISEYMYTIATLATIDPDYYDYYSDYYDYSNILWLLLLLEANTTYQEYSDYYDYSDYYYYSNILWLLWVVGLLK